MQVSKLRLLFAFLISLGLLMTASAAPDDDVETKEKPTAKKDKDEDSADNEEEEEEEEDEEEYRPRVPGLAELRIDEKIMSARALNLPIPGATRTVQDLLDQLEEFSEEDKVGGVLMDVGNVALQMADVEELRGAIEKVSENGKRVLAFINGGNANAYLLASAADEIAIAPIGSIEISGIGRLFAFEKGYHQMQGSEYQVITAGRFKYPGFLNSREPNEFFREEFGAILDSQFDAYVEMIAEGRDIDEEKVRELIDQAIFTAPQAQQNGLVDVVSYYDEYRDRVLKREKMKKYRDSSDTGLEDINSIQDLVEWMNDRMKDNEEDRKAVGPKIAVLHARGPIVDMNLGAAVASQMICRDDFSKVVDQLRRNKSIKAVVLRIDSPGGSAYASDVIWRHLRKLDEEKPLVVSMGTVAGSGGYYIACPARKIVAQPTTITGSIGVLGILESRRSAFNRMDIELAPMQRGDKALLGMPHRELSEEEKEFFQDYILNTYDIFIERVATGRKRPETEIREIAEGRIWSGRDALEIGLVDELGGLETAIEAARDYANIPKSAELNIVHYPRTGSLGELISSLGPLAAAADANSLLTAYSRAAQPAELSLQQQLGLVVGSKLQPLCWMATPGVAPRPVRRLLQSSDSRIEPGWILSN